MYYWNTQGVRLDRFYVTYWYFIFSLLKYTCTRYMLIVNGRVICDVHTSLVDSPNDGLISSTCTMISEI